MHPHVTSDVPDVNGSGILNFRVGIPNLLTPYLDIRGAHGIPDSLWELGVGD